MVMVEAGRKQREVEANLPMKVFGTGGRSVGRSKAASSFVL